MKSHSTKNTVRNSYAPVQSTLANAVIAALLCTQTASVVAEDFSDIERIAVTASPTAKAIKTLSHNLSVIDSEQLSLTRHEHINQVFNTVPGGWISRGNGQEHLTAIRSPVLTGAGGCGAYFMAQDGISLRAPGFCNTNQLFDVNTEQAERIEVLRGPSSVDYGSNAVHGVINVLTPDAIGFDSQNISLSAGPHDYLKGSTQLATQWNNHGLLMQLNASHDGGYKEESGYDQQKFDIIHQYQSDNLSIKNVLSGSNLNQETAGFIQGFESYKDDSFKKTNPNPEAFRDSQSLRGYSVIEYTQSSDTSFTITPYFRWTDMAFLQHFLPWKALEENSQKSVGINVRGIKRFESITLYYGLDSDFTEGKLTETQAEDFAPTLPAGTHYDYTVDAHVISPFMQFDWQASSGLNITGGVRYDMTEYDYDNHESDGSACAPEVTNCRFTRPTDQTADYDELSYQLGASYALGENLYLYSQFSTGYRAPQATELFRLQAGQTIAELDAEELVSYELGMRGQTAALSYDVSLFTMEKSHFIFQDSNRQNISNGETSHQGIELSVRYQLPHQFYLSAHGTLASHEYDNSLAIARTDIKGNEIDTAPEHMGSIQLGWRSEHINSELEWVHMGNYYLNPENTAEYGGHNLLNLRAAYQYGSRWRFSARLLNLTDEDYAERADFGFGNYRYFVGEPRSLFVSVDYFFR